MLSKHCKCIYKEKQFICCRFAYSQVVLFVCLQVVGEAVVSRKVTAHITFTNPLPVNLKGGVFTVEGAGLTAATEVLAP